MRGFNIIPYTKFALLVLKVNDSKPLVSQVLAIYLYGGNISVELNVAKCNLG